MGMIARAAPGRRRPTPTTGAPRSPATGRATLTTLAAIEAMGWRALTIYECELKDAAALRNRLAQALIR